MKNYDKTGGKKGKPAYRTPSWFKSAPSGGYTGKPGKQKGIRPPFRKPSV